jgi:hypothetical protein
MMVAAAKCRTFATETIEGLSLQREEGRQA